MVLAAIRLLEPIAGRDEGIGRTVATVDRAVGEIGKTWAARLASLQEPARDGPRNARTPPRRDRKGNPAFSSARETQGEPSTAGEAGMAEACLLAGVRAGFPEPMLAQMR